MQWWPWKYKPSGESEIDPLDTFWPFWPIVPLYPFAQRQTLRREVVRESVWVFEQVQGIFYVVVPIRMTVVKLETGGLLVYAPVAPTRECLRLMQELVAEHGEVRYIILPTISGLEHKVFVGPFARRFPTAQVFVAPRQWSFPINLPLSWLGLPIGRTHILPEDSRQAPFADQIDYALLGPIDLGLAPFAEVACFDRRSQTLLVTDAILVVPEDPPAIVQLDPYPLLFHARDQATDPIEDRATHRRKGWQRIVLFALYFRPSALETLDLWPAFLKGRHAPDRSRKAYFGIYPFQWKEAWTRSFEAVRGGGRLLVAPILQRLILNRDPQATLAWVDQVAQWNFRRIVPCHFVAPIEAGPQEFQQAFAFLQPARSQAEIRLPEEDFELLEELDETLTQLRVTPPRASNQG